MSLWDLKRKLLSYAHSRETETDLLSVSDDAGSQDAHILKCVREGYTVKDVRYARDPLVGWIEEDTSSTGTGSGSSSETWGKLTRGSLPLPHRRFNAYLHSVQDEGR